jgi:hypothetical protein
MRCRGSTSGPRDDLTLDLGVGLQGADQLRGAPWQRAIGRRAVVPFAVGRPSRPGLYHEA